MKLTIPMIIDDIRDRGAIPTLLMVPGVPAELIALEQCEVCGCDCVGANPVTVSRKAALMSHFFGVREINEVLPDLQPFDDGSYGCPNCVEKEK